MQAYGRIQQGLPHNLELNCSMSIIGFYGVRRSFKSERKCQRQKVLNFGNPTQPADYCDGRSSIRCGTDKRKLVNPRDVSLFLQNRNPPNRRVNHERTHLMTSFGQFLTHTAIQTPDVGGSGVKCSCSSSEKNCVLIDINPSRDPALDDINCFFITRSSGECLNKRQDLRL